MLSRTMMQSAVGARRAPMMGLASLAPMSVATATQQFQLRTFGGEMRHHNTDVDNQRIPWDFTQESYKKIDVIMAKFPRSRRRSGVIPLLHLAQVQNGGWIPVTAMYKIAKICEVAPMSVFETVTFYAMFNRKPVGKYHVQFCVTTPCMLRGCDDLIHKAEHYLNVHMGGTTHDKMFTLGEMECMGCCVNAPMIVVSDYTKPENFSYEYYEDLDWESLKGIFNALREGKPTRLGTQLPNRKYSEPAGGKTTLKMTEPPKPHWRDLDAKPEVKK